MKPTMSQRLREERQNSNLSQEALAVFGGITKTTLFNYEDGRDPASSFLQAIAQHGFDTHYILTGERTSTAAKTTPQIKTKTRWRKANGWEAIACTTLKNGRSVCASEAGFDSKQQAQDWMPVMVLRCEREKQLLEGGATDDFGFSRTAPIFGAAYEQQKSMETA